MIRLALLVAVYLIGYTAPAFAPPSACGDAVVCPVAGMARAPW